MNTADSIKSLEAARDAARHCHPRVVELRSVLSAADSTPEQRRAAQTELAALRPERVNRRDQGVQGLLEAQEELSLARRRAREEANAEAAAKLSGATTADLVKRRAEVTQQRRALKSELRAIVTILGERAAEERAAELLATLSDADKRALLQRLLPEGVESAEKVGIPGGS